MTTSHTTGSIPLVAGWPIILNNAFMPKLVVIEGPARGAVYVLAESDVSIGRSSGNDIAIADISLSRRHSAVRYEDGSYRVRDLESHNGTFVNQVAVTER